MLRGPGHMVYNPRIVRIIRSSPIMLEKIRKNLAAELLEVTGSCGADSCGGTFPLATQR